MTEKLVKTVREFVEIPDRAMDKLLQIVKPTSWQAGDHFIREGQIPRKFGFVAKGLFRYLYLNKDGREFTKAFFPENTFISSYTAMINNMPSFLSANWIRKYTLLRSPVNW